MGAQRADNEKRTNNRTIDDERTTRRPMTAGSRRLPVAPGGGRLAAVPVVVGALVLPFFPGVAAALFVLGFVALAFHRDPDRSPSGDGILAPADGRIRVVREEAGRLRVGVFMNVHDVHVNRAPAPGTVTAITHEPGGHWPAFAKDAERNERVHIDLDTSAGAMRVTQIAGTFARRIHPYVEVDDDLARGDRIGHISFGSRVDVVFPQDVDRAALCVERGDRVKAGETVLVSDKRNA